MMCPGCHRPIARSAHRGPSGNACARGFTMVELLVALTAGLFVASAAFLLARNSSRFFQHEAAISTAQFAAMTGLGRLQADLQRAAFLSSPNVTLDPLRIGDMTTWPIGLKVLAGVSIEKGGSVSHHLADHNSPTGLSSLNGLAPDSIVVGGSFATTEQFAARAMFGGGGAPLQIYLQWDDGPMQRTKAAAESGGNTLDNALGLIFAPRRFLRIVDDEGRQAYGQIEGFAMQDPTTPVVTVEASPRVPTDETDGIGFSGMGIGTLVNPVYRVLYDVRVVDPAVYTQYQGLFVKGRHAVQAEHKGAPLPPRTELVRVEHKQLGEEIETTLEVVAEYAVDLKFGLTEAEPPFTAPLLRRYPLGADPVYEAAAPLDASPAGRPQRIRSVQVQLSTRGEVRDRDLPIPALSGGNLLRYSLGTGAGYVRVRTLVTDVALPNQAGVGW